MKRRRFSEEQIIAILKEQEASMKTADLCRKHGISGATFYKWKSKYGGLDVSEARRLKVLEDENAKLKKLLAEAMSPCASARDGGRPRWGCDRMAPRPYRHRPAPAKSARRRRHDRLVQHLD